jgi:hypothetical protein
MADSALDTQLEICQEAGVDTLAVWAGRVENRRAAPPRTGRLRFAFYGRVSTEDYQDPVTSRARQWHQAAALIGGSGRIIAEYFDVGQSRCWDRPVGRRPQRCWRR